MPELPEVEVVRRGLLASVVEHRVEDAVVRERRLRWPVPADLAEVLRGRLLRAVERRGKYLLLRFAGGTLIVHLGMSGSLRFLPQAPPPRRHDHVDLVFEHGVLRYHDPRRFGAMLWHPDEAGDVLLHPLLAGLGVEPFSQAFDGGHLHRATRGRRVAIKQLLLAGDAVVGVGNIYASESLHRAGIHPCRAAARISGERYERLARSVVAVLREAISAGGTTLRDFVASDGSPGYFRARLAVYDRAGEPCGRCGTRIRRLVVGQRATYYCPTCQR